MAEIKLQHETLELSGDWTLHGIEAINDNPLCEIVLPTFPLTLDGSNIEKLDSAGVILIQKLEENLKAAKIPTTRKGFDKSQNILINLVERSQLHSEILNVQPPKDELSFFAKVGRATIEKYKEFYLWMSFIGEFAIILFKMLLNPERIPWRSIVATIDFTGIRSMPIIAFLAFLIGVVLAYQIGVQLESYGANIYIVNFLGLAIFREFGPLIAAIILAGRVSSAFTAHIGLMKTNEELDALQTMGLCPTELLITPRVIGMVIAMPLLIVWCDIFGIMGGMLMANLSLGISYKTFLTQFPEVIKLSSFFMGLSKAPTFALIVSSVGCFHGMRVSGSASSIGSHTTKSVVLAIFLIIIADAIYSIVFSFFGM